MEKRLRDTLTAMIQINGLSPFLFNEPPSNSTSGILILPGLRDHKYREEEGIKTWRKLGVRYLLVAGTREKPPMERGYIVNLAGKDSPDIFFTHQADHTGTQVEWAMDIIKDKIRNLTHLIISTAAYHLPRCYLSFLNSMLKREMLFPLSAAPLYDPQNPMVDFTGYIYTGETGIEGEANRIMQYQDKGDVASLAEYARYLEWRLSR